MGRISLVLGALVLAACGTSGDLIVQVRTDLLPQREMRAIEVRIVPPVGAEQLVTTEATADRDWANGVRVAERRSLDPGVYRLLVAAVDEAGELIVARPVRVEVMAESTRVVTVVLTRDCQGVRCPYEGGDPSFTACLAGRCVQESCTEETPDTCAVPECASAADCPAVSDECAAAMCTDSGACLPALDHASCGAGSICTTHGCEPESCGWGTFSDARAIDELSSFDTAYGPSISGDGLELFYTTRPADLAVHVAIRDDPTASFGSGTALELGAGDQQSEPSVSLDGLRVYFAGFDAVDVKSIFVASRPTRADPFGPAELVDVPDVGQPNVTGPDLSADERVLVFCAGPDNYELELYVTRRESVDAPFETPIPLTELEPVGFPHAYPSISADGLTLYYHADDGSRPRLWVARRASRDEPFAGGVEVAGLPGTDTEEDPDVSFDGREIYYNVGDPADLWVARRACAP